MPELVEYCEVLSYSYKKSLDAAADDGSHHLICPSSAAAAHTDPNISKDGIHGEYMLVFSDPRKNITPKYNKRLFIISCNYK